MRIQGASFMHHSLFIIVALTIGLACLSAAPVPKQPLTPLAFFPSSKGTKWVYEISGDKDELVTESIASVSHADYIHTITMIIVHEETSRGIKMKETSIGKVRLSPAGIFMPNPWGEAPASSICLLSFPVKTGANWEEEHPSVNLKRSCVVFEPERITVPAGTYSAIRVETSYAYDGMKYTKFCDDWYSPGIGLVKHDRRDVVRTKVLKSFTLGAE